MKIKDVMVCVCMCVRVSSAEERAAGLSNGPYMWTYGAYDILDSMTPWMRERWLRYKKNDRFAVISSVRISR